MNEVQEMEGLEGFDMKVVRRMKSLLVRATA